MPPLRQQPAQVVGAEGRGVAVDAEALSVVGGGDEAVEAFHCGLVQVRVLKDVEGVEPFPTEAVGPFGLGATRRVEGEARAAVALEGLPQHGDDPRSRAPRDGLRRRDVGIVLLDEDRSRRQPDLLRAIGRRTAFVVLDAVEGQRVDICADPAAMHRQAQAPVQEGVGRLLRRRGKDVPGRPRPGNLAIERAARQDPGRLELARVAIVDQIPELLPELGRIRGAGQGPLPGRASGEKRRHQQAETSPGLGHVNLLCACWNR